MTAKTKERLTETVSKINEILQPHNRVLVLDFSLFLEFESDDHDISVMLFGYSSLCARYEALLKEAVKEESYIKYGADLHRFVRDFPDSRPAAEAGEYRLHSSRELFRTGALVKTSTDEALKWLDYVNERQLCGAALAFAKEMGGIQSNVYVLLERGLSLGTDTAVSFDGKEPWPYSQSVSFSKLKEVFDELDRLLSNEMAALAFEHLKRDRQMLAFAEHEIDNVDSMLSHVKTPESKMGLAHGLCVVLRGGFRLNAERADSKIRREEVDGILTALKEHAGLHHIDLRWEWRDQVPALDWWEVFAIIEVTRNAIKGLRSGSISWQVALSGATRRVLKCVSGDYLFESTGVPPKGAVKNYPRKGLDLIRFFAKKNRHSPSWRWVHPDPGEPACRLEFLLEPDPTKI